MSDKWTPQNRRFCRFCNCWFADNKISIENHEKGTSHQANVEKELNRTRKEKQNLAAAERILASEMQKIEMNALKAFEEDAKRDPFARDEMDRLLEAKPGSASTCTKKI